MDPTPIEVREQLLQLIEALSAPEQLALLRLLKAVRETFPAPPGPAPR